MVSPWGDITVEYAVGDFSPSSQWPSNNKYHIKDYGFLRVTSIGTHPGDYASPDEPSDPGPYLTNGQWFEANLNNDEHTDLIYIGNNCCNRDFVLEDLMLTFINDGNGHFELNSNLFADNTFPCVQGGRSWLADEFDPLHPCGNQQDYTNGKIVADFNGDGISDYYDTSILYLSNSEGKLENKSFSNLPELFFLEGHGQIFVHDATYGDLDGDGDLDIFVPISDYTELGFKFGGDADPCSGCTTQIPYTALINDGSGNFSANHKIPQFDYWVEYEQKHGYPLSQLWPTTTAIGDFDNDGYGDIALGWFNPEISHLYGFSENSSGVVYFNDGSNDWTQRGYVELPTNFFGANGNANDMEVFDFNNDGFLDIVLASTTHEPYYNSRVIQFFQNQGGTSFMDVTASISPDYAEYANGNPYSAWWVGQGKLHILDYDHDGDLDIIDVSTRTSVFLNNGSSFNLYDDFVDADEDILLWPIEIDGKYHYDFIGSHQVCNPDRCITNFYQLLDPPALALSEDFFSRADNFVHTLVAASYIGDDIRFLLNSEQLVYKNNATTDLLGFSSNANKFQIVGGQLMGKHLGNFFGATYEISKFRIGIIINKASTFGSNSTRWFGNNSAELFYKSTESFVEINIFKSNQWILNIGKLNNDTLVENFFEEGGIGSFGYLSSNLAYDANYASAIYRANLFGIDSELMFGTRQGKSKQPFSLITTDSINFASLESIHNDYFAVSLFKGPYFLNFSSNSNFGNHVVIGLQFTF